MISCPKIYDHYDNFVTLQNDGFIMTHKRKAKSFFQKIENFGGEIFLCVTPLFHFVSASLVKICSVKMTGIVKVYNKYN